MWMLEWLLSILTYPISWFWQAYARYKEEKCVWKIIALFVVSLSGLAAIGFVVIWLLSWLLLYHFEVVLIGCFIVWLYSYIYSKLNEKPTQEETVDVGLQELQEQAAKVYPMMRNIMYQTLKGSAESIGGIIPRLLQEIEVLEGHYIITNGICFFQFRLSKVDIKIRYEAEELREFQRILQNDISRSIQAGKFPTLGIEQYLDNYGNVYDAIYIDVIEDLDNCFRIQAVLYSPAYADYLRKKRMNQQNQLADASAPDANWNGR